MATNYDGLDALIMPMSTASAKASTSLPQPPLIDTDDGNSGF